MRPALDMNLDDLDVDTLAGVLMSRAQKLPKAGDKIEFDEATAEILEVKGDHAKRIRIVSRSEQAVVPKTSDKPAPDATGKPDALPK